MATFHLVRRFSSHYSKNSRRLWLFLGSVRGFVREVEGKFWEECWKIFPESPNALNSRISGTGQGKPAANLGANWLGFVPTFRVGCFRNRRLAATSGEAKFLGSGQCSQDLGHHKESERLACLAC